MAITATIAVSSATAKNEQRVGVACTVSNSGSSAVNVTAIVPKMVVNGTTPQTCSVALGAPNTGPGMTVSVAASGSTIFYWDVLAHAPQSGYGLAEAASVVYSVGATIYTSDGSITAATATTVTVTPNSHT